MNARAILDSKISEKDFQDTVIELFRLHKWHVTHFRPARMKDGSWRTAIQGDKGFPDTVIAKEGKPLILAELKSENGKLTAEQIQWQTILSLVELDSMGAVKVYVWKPSMWNEIEAIAKGEE